MSLRQQKKVYDAMLLRIDEATEPSRMPRSDAEDFLGALIDDLKIRLEALREERCTDSAIPKDGGR